MYYQHASLSMLASLQPLPIFGCATSPQVDASATLFDALPGTTNGWAVTPSADGLAPPSGLSVSGPTATVKNPSISVATSAAEVKAGDCQAFSNKATLTESTSGTPRESASVTKTVCVYGESYGDRLARMGTY